MKNALSISDHYVWDYLFEGWIDLCSGTGLKTVVFLVQDCWQIAINISAETLKNAQLLKKRAGKNENIFTGNRHDGMRIQELEFGHQNLAAGKSAQRF